MASTRTRRSGRGIRSVKYFKEESSDEEEYEGVAEHDKVKLKAAKNKLKQMIRDDSDAESDFEQELIKKQSIAQQSSDDDMETDEDTAAVERKYSLEQLRDRESVTSAEKSLKLSESDSSDSEREHEQPVRKRLASLKGKGHSMIQEEEEEEVAGGASMLIALAGNLGTMKDVWQEQVIKTGLKTNDIETKNSSKVKSQKRKSLEKSSITKKLKKDEGKIKKVSRFFASEEKTMSPADESISQLLTQGEGMRESLTDSDQEEEEVEKQPVTAKDGVEVTVELPAHLRKRMKKKKGFDVEAFLKRELGRARREVGVLLQQSGLVCRLAHLLHLHCSLQSPTLQAQALSVLPAAHTEGNLTLARLAALTAWVRENIPVSGAGAGAEAGADCLPTRTRLSRALQSRLALSLPDLVLIFLLACRALGHSARLVLNCLTTTLPAEEKEKKEIKEEKEIKNETAPVKSSTRQSKPKKVRKPSGSDSEVEEETKKRKSRSNKSKPTVSGSSSSRLAEAAKKRKSSKLSSVKTEEELIEKISKGGRASSSKAEQSNKSKQASSTRDKEKVKAKEGRDYWAEVRVGGHWVAADLYTGKLNCAAELESRASRPLLYCLAVDNAGGVTDVTRRYAGSFLTVTRKQRLGQDWIEALLQPWRPAQQDTAEEAELARKTDEAPMPTNISAFKGHPLYVLERHLLKFEALYPASLPPLGWVRGEPVYARECVHTLLGRTAWLKEGRTVKLGEQPYKVVKARPKYDRMTGNVTKDEPLETFGQWQTEQYQPPPAVDGKVPRNEYGNVELFKPWMLPGGCVHIPINGMQRAIRASGIDAAPAMVGWDFSGGGCHPVYDGYVVCQENAEALMDAWNGEQEERARRERDKREKRVADNWKRLVKGLMFREKMKAKYMQEQGAE